MRTSKGSAILRGKVGREWSQCDGSFSKCSKTGVRTRVAMVKILELGHNHPMS